MLAFSCKDQCRFYKQTLFPGHSGYKMGKKWCTNCNLFLISETARCPCCNCFLRTRPRSRMNKERFRYDKYVE